MKTVLKNLLNIVKLSLVLILVSPLVSCKTSYDELIDAFNKKYFVPERPVEDVFSATSEDFIPDTMLEEYYTFKKGYYVNLEAPSDAASYLWTYSDIDEEKTPVVIGTEQFLYLNTSEAFNYIKSNEKSHSFKLVLTITVTGTEGTVTEYIDTSTITIIDQSSTGHGGF